MSKKSDLQFNSEAYDLWSKQYDLEANSTIAADERFFPPIWQHVKGERVLEIGCGTGRHTQRLIALGNWVTAIDPSKGMLEIAKTKIASDRIRFILADFLEYQWPKGTIFKAAITSLVLEHISDLDLFFQTVYGLLEEGGELFLSEIHPLRIASGSQAKFTDLHSNEQILLRSFAHQEKGILRAASEAGFQCILSQDYIGDETLTSLHPGWEKYLGKPMIKILAFKRIGPNP